MPDREDLAMFGATSVGIHVEDTANIDSYDRLRVTTPTGLFDAQFTHDLQPLLFEQIVAGVGATVAYDATNRNATIAFASTPSGGQSAMQTFESFRYQPGKTQNAYISFNFREAVAGVVKFAGYSDGTNGFEFILNGLTPAFRILSGTEIGNQTVNQSDWNMDKLDGTGKSGVTLDITKTQIVIFDIQALYTGRIRMGFLIGGRIVYAHAFTHANIVLRPYIQTANLPIRVGMSCTATVTTSMAFTCCSVISEGGSDRTIGYEFAKDFAVTAANGVKTHAISLRPRLTFNGIVNRVHFEFIEIALLVTGTDPVEWELCIGQAITGVTTFTNVNTTYSSVDYNTAGTISGAAAVVIDEDYVPATNQSKGQGQMDLTFRYPMTLDAAGNPRLLGTLSLIVTGLGGASACRGALKWRETR